MRSRLYDWVREVRENAESSLTEDYTARQTAASFALAIFLAVLPTFGVAPLIALSIAAVSHRINHYAMVAAFAIFNPFVLSGVLTLSFLIGSAIGPLLPVYHYEIPVPQELFLFTRNILMGNLLLNIVLSTAGYVLAHRFVQQYQDAHIPWDVPERC